MTRPSFLRSALLLVVTFAAAATTVTARAEDPLTVADLQGYYGTPFTLGRQDDAKDPIAKDAPPVTQLIFTAEGSKFLASLLIRTSASPEAALKACNAVREQYGKSGIKIEDAPEAGAHAYWFGRQLNFSKGTQSFVLSANGLTDRKDMAQTHAAALALAKIILERVK